ncbi:acyltransferase domain-containing protein [Actinomadura bangladeshensis]|uniref:Acyltransferase domain-containing protein n=1 Tax=Actinomadura bangladeshensis TaxID=453573 RepID=A0A4R4PE44_9ACTN|nr:acyltransferase domain-containing protein [Actinomadura bangladeshensis]TDC19800.1 acyltransferase domain-containing protein [Actinomadura bangladeshensis]
MTEDHRAGGGRPLPIALLIPGQGAQRPRMAASLYGTDAGFTRTMDEAFALMGPRGPHLRAQWLAERPSPEFDDVTVAQPLLYAVGYALGRAMADRHGPPGALLGHSAGEMVAGALAGVFDFADGMRLMMARLPALAATEPGGMLAVAASVREVEPLLGGDVHLAAVNAPRQLLLAGAEEPLGRAMSRLKADGRTVRRVPARQAFHSPLVAAASDRAGDGWAGVALRPPSVPLYSAYDAAPLTAERACDPAFWIGQPARTVHFARALDRLLDDGDHLLLETGPGQSLTMLARRHPRVLAGRSRVLGTTEELVPQ